MLAPCYGTGVPDAAPSIVLHIQPGFQMPGRPRCFSGTPFAIKVQRILQYKGLAFAAREVGWDERAGFLADRTGAGKLPVLEYDGQIVEDSTAIAHFLEERHPEPPLLPADVILRARCHFLEEWADEVLYWYGIYEQTRLGDVDAQVAAYFPDFDKSALEALAVNMRANVEENLRRQGVGRYPVEKVQADMRRSLGGLVAFIEADGFVAGPVLSLADCALFGQLHRRLAGTNPWLESEVAARPALRDWLARVDALTSGGTNSM